MRNYVLYYDYIQLNQRLSSIDLVYVYMQVLLSYILNLHTNLLSENWSRQ